LNKSNNPSLRLALDNCFSTNSTQSHSDNSFKMNTRELIVYKETLEAKNGPMDTNRSTKDKKFWTTPEDDLLLNFIDKKKTKNWKLVSEHITTKSPQQCAYRYSKLMSDMNKKKWNRKDDIKLIELVETYGQNWEVISSKLIDRSERDVEVRYKEKLDPNVKNSKFTEEEDSLILRLYEEFGNKWFEISRFFKNRTAKMLKKRFHSHIKLNFQIGKKSTKTSKTSKSNTSIEGVKFDCNKSLINEEQFTTKNTTIIPENQPYNMVDNLNSNYNCNILIDDPCNMFTMNEEVREDSFNRDSLFVNDNNTVNCFNEHETDPVNNVSFDINVLPQIDICTPYTKQIDMLDDYFNQVANYINDKKKEFQFYLQNNTFSTFEINNIFNLNSQIDENVDTLMNRIIMIQQERQYQNTDAIKFNILKYIEIIIQLIHLVKSKINLLQTLKSKSTKSINRGNDRYNIFN